MVASHYELRLRAHIRDADTDAKEGNPGFADCRRRDAEFLRRALNNFLAMSPAEQAAVCRKCAA